MHQKPFSARALPGTPMDPYYGYFSSLKEAEARQTCPGFFLKSLLESPGSVLD